MANKDRFTDQILDVVFSTVADAIIVTNNTGEIITINPAAEVLFGYERGELINANIEQLMPRSSRAMHHGYLRAGDHFKAKTVIGKDREISGQRKNGALFPIEIVIGVGTLDGQMVYTAVLRDISVRKSKERTLKILQGRLAAGQTVAGIGTWDWEINTGHLYWSDQVSAMLGYIVGETEANYENFLAAVHAEDKADFELAVQRSLYENREYDIEHRVCWADGTVRWLREQGGVLRLPDGSPERMIGVVQDITEEKKAATEFQALLEREQRASKAKSQFLSNMSHELRTPLNAILGFNQVLDAEEIGALNENQKSCVAHSQRAGRHLLGLIESVLDFSKAEADKIEIKPVEFDFKVVLSEALAVVGDAAELRRCPFHIVDNTNGTRLYQDLLRVRQILINLLSNAIKYNRAGGSIFIKACFGENEVDQENLLCITIADQGAGVEDAQLGNLFKPFERLGNESSGIEGAGVGLALVKRLLELMGGSISYARGEASGSVFSVRLPCRFSSSTAKSSGLNIAPSEPKNHLNMDSKNIGRRKRVLFVEDKDTSAYLLRYIVKSVADIEYKIANGMALGLELINKECPDVLIVDIRLPNLHGLELIQKIRHQQSGMENCSIVAMSSELKGLSLKAVIDAGVDAVIQKPLDVVKVRGVFENLLR